MIAEQGRMAGDDFHHTHGPRFDPWIVNGPAIVSESGARGYHFRLGLGLRLTFRLCHCRHFFDDVFNDFGNLVGDFFSNFLYRFSNVLNRLGYVLNKLLNHVLYFGNCCSHRGLGRYGLCNMLCNRVHYGLCSGLGRYRSNGRYCRADDRINRFGTGRRYCCIWRGGASVRTTLGRAVFRLATAVAAATLWLTAAHIAGALAWLVAALRCVIGSRLHIVVCCHFFSLGTLLTSAVTITAAAGLSLTLPAAILARLIGALTPGLLALIAGLGLSVTVFGWA